jgi:heme a synthase
VWRLESDRAIRRAFHVLAGVVVVQVGLGIATLLTYVPVTLGTIHQGMAVLVLAAVVAADYVASRSPGEERDAAHSARLATA